MCGILGLWQPSPFEAEHFLQMLRTLAHRGPDGERVEALEGGRVFLGHRRLAIIDLSDRAIQPMPNEDSTIWLTYNGEIYNYLELRSILVRAGHVFRSDADSEVVLHAYEEWGADCVRYFRGIFAFGLWDSTTQTMFLARDHLGVKPLYYAISDDRLVFASEPRAILAHPDIPRDIDLPALRDFFALGYVPGARCIFRGLKKLPAAHTAVFRRGRLTLERYWSARATETITDPEEATWRIEHKILEAVRLQLASDVTVGAFLSGGVDSSLVTAVARSQATGTFPTFTIGFDVATYDETTFARELARSCHTDHHEQVLSRSKMLAIFFDAIDSYDEPFEPDGSFPAYLVSSLAKQHSTKVVLGGDGADELFVGYLWYDQHQQAFATRGPRFLRAFRSSRAPLPPPSAWLGSFFSYNGVIGPDLQSEFFTTSALKAFDSDVLSVYRPFSREDTHPVTGAQLMDLNIYLPDHILCKVDRAGMANGVEVRVPFLDHQLVQLALSIPLEILYRRQERKALLKKVASAYVPSSLLTQRKKGFSSPLYPWTDAPLRDWAHSLIDEGYLLANGIVRRDWRLAIQSSSPRLKLRAFWLLLAAELWCRRWLLREPRHNLPVLPAALADS